tara:strand:+ start:406 stop:1029 length:624 start_codon:yes stop_codon:yes gene_type:complete
MFGHHNEIAAFLAEAIARPYPGERAREWASLGGIARTRAWAYARLDALGLPPVPVVRWLRAQGAIVANGGQPRTVIYVAFPGTEGARLPCYVFHRGAVARIIDIASRPVDSLTYTDAGYLYAIQQGHAGPVKFGISMHPADRLKRLQVGNPYRLRLLVSVPGGRDRERAVHAALSGYRASGEWFHPVADVLAVVETMKQEPGAVFDR